MPCIGSTIAAGQSLPLSWTLPTTNTDGTALTGSLTSNLYESLGPGQPFSPIASGLVSPAYILPNLAAGTPCIYVVVDDASETIPLSNPSGILCVAVSAAAEQPNPPTNLTFGVASSSSSSSSAN